MQYLSFAFAIFVIVIFSIYCLLPQKFRWTILLAGSVFFYLCFEPRYIFFLMFVALSTFLLGRFSGNEKRNNVYFIICILLNVGLWFAIKVLPWFGDTINSIISKCFEGVSISIPQFIIPIGISYYVLQALSYVIDVYKKRIEPEKNFFKYLLYLSFFPTIVQGPISKYGQLREKLTAGIKIGYVEFKRSLLLIAFGLIKKMVIADRIGILANDCFQNYMELEGVILYVGAVSYAIQLYMDFSGCVDVCRGVSSLFGIELMDNFSAPYFAKSIKEFWGRWHISLSTWLKDYIYIPLGGNRRGKIRKYMNLLVTFGVSGIWHGAGFNYMAWGFLQGGFQIVGECTYNARSKVKRFLKIESDSISDKIYRTLITFHLTVFSWIFFRSNGLMSAVEYIMRMFNGWHWWRIFGGGLFLDGLSFAHIVVLVINIFVITFIDYVRSKKEISVENCILGLHVLLRWTIYFILIFDIIFFGVYGKGYDMAGFLYGGF